MTYLCAKPAKSLISALKMERFCAILTTLDGKVLRDDVDIYCKYVETTIQKLHSSIKYEYFGTRDCQSKPTISRLVAPVDSLLSEHNNQHQLREYNKQLSLIFNDK